MKPTILIYNDTECAVYNVFTGLQPYLELTYNVIYHDWKNTDQSYFEKEKISDIVISGVDGYYYLKTFRQLHEFKKFIIVSHGYCEFLSPLPKEGLIYGSTSSYINHFFPSEAHVHFVPNGVNHNFFNYKERTGEIKTLGWCGRVLLESKRHEMAVKIADSLDLPLSNASENGYKTQNEMKEWYHTIDLLLITSGPEIWHETGPLPAFEAIVSGVLVIGTRVGNFADVPGPKFSTIQEAHSIIFELRKRPEEVVRLAKEQYECVMNKWIYEKTYPKWKDLIELIIKPKKKVLVYGPVGWSVERVHLDVEKYLKDEFIFNYYDWRKTDFSTFDSVLAQHDVCLTQIASIDFFKNNNVKVDWKKCLFVSHGGCEFKNVVLPKEILTYGMTSYEITHFFPKGNPVFLMRNGVDPNHFRYAERNGRINTFGWCGDIRIPSKNYTLGLDISNHVGIPLNTASSLTFAEMKEWYHTIDVLLITSGPEKWVETGPLPAFEAIVSGALVIGTNIGNFSKIPGPKFSTLEEAAEIIEKLKEDPELVKKYAKIQYDTVMTYWTYRTISNEWRNALRYSFQNGLV